MKLKKYNKNFEYYLAGMIEGEGQIIVPKTLYSDKGKINYPSIQLYLNLQDFPLGMKIQEILGFGSIHRKKGVNAYVLSVNCKEGIYNMINILNGKMRTPKINSLYKLMDWYETSFAFEKLPLNTEALSSNSWLAGFIEVGGSFQIRSTMSGKYPRVECKLEITQRQVDHLNYDNLEFLKAIADFCLTQVKSIREDKPIKQYRVRTKNVQGNEKIEDYLNNYPLFGSKHLDSKKWMRVLQFFKGKESRELMYTTAAEMKTQMNENRTEWNWDHLKNMYRLEE